MEEKKLQERISKFNKDFNKTNLSNNKLISAREKNNLQLRKNKIEEIIMQKRMASFIRISRGLVKEEKYNHLLLSFDELTHILPSYIDQEFDVYDDKVGKIKEFLFNYLSLDNPLNEALSKYAVYKMRKITSEWKNENEETLEVETHLLDLFFRLLQVTTDKKLQYEITFILINLTFESSKYTNYLIEEEILEILFSLMNSGETGIIYHSIWIFANIFDCQENATLILQRLDNFNFIPRMIKIVDSFSNLFLYSDLIKNATWLVYRIIRYEQSVITSFAPLFDHLLNFLDYEVSRIKTIKKSGIESNSEDNQILTNLLLIFNRITQSSEDEEVFKYLAKPAFVYNLIKLHTEDLVEDESIYLVFRVIGGLCSSMNSSTDTVVSCGYLDSVESYLYKCFNKNSFNILSLRDLAFSISNISAESDLYSDKIVKYQILELLLNLLNNVKDAKLNKEILYVFYNCFEFGSLDSREKIISYDKIYSVICDCIKNPNKEYTKVSLDFLRLILHERQYSNYANNNFYKEIKLKLENYGLPSYLENLHLRSEEDISSIAESILLDHWDFEEICQITKNVIEMNKSYDN